MTTINPAPKILNLGQISFHRNKDKGLVLYNESLGTVAYIGQDKWKQLRDYMNEICDDEAILL